MAMRICVSCSSVANSNDKSRCKPCFNAKFRKYRKDNPEIFRKLDRKYQLKTKYGITPEMYEKLYLEQKGLCKICFTHKDLLNIDHDHNTGRVRALLCTYCNIVVGNIERVDLRKFLDYVHEYANLR